MSTPTRTRSGDGCLRGAVDESCALEEPGARQSSPSTRQRHLDDSDKGASGMYTDTSETLRGHRWQLRARRGHDLEAVDRAIRKPIARPPAEPVIAKTLSRKCADETNPALRMAAAGKMKCATA